LTHFSSSLTAATGSAKFTAATPSNHQKLILNTF
jgi:hypothetical protein